MALPIATARLLGIFFTDIFLAMQLITFFHSLWIQLFKRREKRRNRNWLLIAVTLAMGTIGVLNASTDLALNNQVLVVTGGDISLYTDLTYWMNLVQNCCMILQPIIGDAMLVYRFWAVYGRNWKATIPFVVLWLGASSMLATFFALSVQTQSPAGLNLPLFTPYIAAGLSLTAANNIIATSLIAHRLWTVSSAVRDHILGANGLQLVMRIVIESGLLYTVTIIVFLGTTVSRGNADYIFGGVVVQITAIAFHLMIIRVSNRLAMGESGSQRGLPCSSLNTLTSIQPIGVSPSRYYRSVEMHIYRDTPKDDELELAN
ncbi:hypothetical protein OBBRIDRAFT_835305 [Obba rivulosa]|uniref:Uncharacterized protein n=1 Tax=Obba rivulosa TaxID=1052685 RepID=A0A8E2DJ74_9APHY|nr:hypothetical protein OBBRIDRAFT_835305 [Obba rivulosa]